MSEYYDFISKIYDKVGISDYSLLLAKVYWSFLKKNIQIRNLRKIWIFVVVLILYVIFLRKMV